LQVVGDRDLPPEAHRQRDQELLENAPQEAAAPKMGIDPVTQTAQWESARLEAEAHMARAREARRLRALAASESASVSASPQMPGPAAAHQLDSPTSMLSF